MDASGPLARIRPILRRRAVELPSVPGDGSPAMRAHLSGVARRAADALVAAILAPVCLSCTRVLDAPTRTPLCDACWRRLVRFTPPVCDACGLPLPRAEAAMCPSCRLAVQHRRLRAVGPYDGVLRDVIHALKFEGRRSLAERLVPLVREAAGDLVHDADAAVPVPLHPWRQWRRGFNQAELIAAGLGLPVWRVLARSRATRAQSALDGAARRANVAGAFRPAGWTARARRRTAQRIRGRRLVLVDDVLTTGATAEACASTLIDAGAAEVRIVAVARVENRR
jgi:ComF family protein